MNLRVASEAFPWNVELVSGGCRKLIKHRSHAQQYWNLYSIAYLYDLLLSQQAVFLNVVRGFTVTDTAGDLAVAAAICSSFLELPIPKGTAFIGEVGLSGELRMVPGIDKRVNTLAKLGYRMCVVPKQAEKLLETSAISGWFCLSEVWCSDLSSLTSVISFGFKKLG
ncbi:hypothetical protein VNO80_28029 [Phaseolus coccineus]|uniref:Lon proteolytic domain-containing protein n=1 Tax=Phaseolus coccineus TaxID=3886 RepID=A0AAN9LM05_PHACN